MSEVDKMYENCGIYPDCRARECGLDYCANSSGCGYAVYPDFTAEKQIAILQLLTQQCDLTISHFREWEFIHYDGQEPLKITGKDFIETFAKLINTYWQDLTEEEKQQVKGILE